MSKKQLKNADYMINQFCKKHQQQMSYSTRHSMSARLKTIYRDLDQLGCNKLPHLKNIKQKHIEQLVEHWKKSGLSAGTIKNRMANIRFVCDVYGRSTVVKSNDDLGIERRSYIPTENKAVNELTLDNINDERLRMSLELQQQFGLRREECLKIKPLQAYRETDANTHYLKLQASWTKGGIERIIPITTPEQLKTIKKAMNLVGKESMIPKNMTYIERRNQYDDLTHRAGMKNLHGLRHAYAQRRYIELTNYHTKGNGWRSPIDGGPKRNELTPDQKYIDKMVREVISYDLGHSREAIVKNYIG